MSRGSETDTKGSFLFSSIISEFHNESTNKKDINILDFGCGTGKLASELALKGYTTYGCDVYKGWGDSKNTTPPQNNFKIISLAPYKLPFPDDFFDFVISSSVMEHVTNKEEVFREIKRILKKGGRAIHCFPSKHFLPSEPHLQVPLLNYFLPYLPKFWLYLWAFLKVRKKYGSPQELQGKDMKISEVVEENIEYCKKYLFYWKNSEYEKISTMIFGNYSWSMDLYIKHAKNSTIARIFKKLPFKRLSGFFIQKFRMSLLILKKD